MQRKIAFVAVGREFPVVRRHVFQPSEILYDTRPTRYKTPAVVVAVGGWPRLRTIGVPNALQMVRDYLEETRRVDISHVEGTRRERPGTVKRHARLWWSRFATRQAVVTPHTTMRTLHGGQA